MLKKIAIVTGATKGIGKSIAKQLIKDGCLVIGTHVQDYDADFIKESSNENFVLKRLDVGDHDACLGFAKEIMMSYGRIDILVNNAGVTKDRLLMMMSPHDFDSVINVNLKGTFNMSQVFSKHFMKQKSGVIINITSVIGIVGNAGQSNYAASKAGVIGFSKSLAKELASRNVRVNCIAPGFIETAMTHDLSESIRKDIENKIALKRFGSCEDVANAVSFLASEKAAYITGQVLNVCGGMVI